MLGQFRVRSLGMVRIQDQWYEWSRITLIKWTDEYFPRMDSMVPLTHHDPSDLRSLILIRIIPMERTFSVCHSSIQKQIFIWCVRKRRVYNSCFKLPHKTLRLACENSRHVVDVSNGFPTRVGSNPGPPRHSGLKTEPTSFPAKWPLMIERRNSIRPIRSTTQIWVVKPFLMFYV